MRQLFKRIICNQNSHLHEIHRTCPLDNFSIAFKRVNLIIVAEAKRESSHKALSRSILITFPE
jgi:hypothetical protein